MRAAGVAIVAVGLLAGTGCFNHVNGPDAMSPRVQGPIAVPPPGTVPSELVKIPLPPYVVESPDILLIEVVVRAKVPELDAAGVPVKNPKTGEVVLVDGTQKLPVHAVSGQFNIRPDGTIGLGYWGNLQVSGLTLDQTAEAIRQHLIANKTLKELGTKPESLVVIVDVLAYNSKKYYVIMDGGGFGEQVFPFPITGSETVLDALSNAFGLPAVASKRNIWVARRTPHPDQPWQILPVDWIGITQHGITTTNYQIMPGDRIYVKAQRIITVDTTLARMLSPVERLFGITLLGANTVNQISGRAFNGNNNGQ
jgi:polysaccharide export outer membrane protein